MERTAGGADRLDRWIYHFTHIDNVPGIVATGRMLCDTTARQGSLRQEVGDLTIKNARRRRRIPAGPGGSVADYVPFYFAPRSPMMFRIACDHRDSVPGRYPDGDRPLVYLVSSVRTIISAGLPWVATDGNAASAATEFSTDAARLADLIDWPLMTAERWDNTGDDPDRQRRRMAEFLVSDAVPLSAVRWLGAYDAAKAAQLRNILGGHPLVERILVRPAWYYGYTCRGR